MASSHIRGKYVVSRAGTDANSSTVITDGALFQRDGVIEEVGAYNDLKSRHDADEEIGGQDYIVFPGLVNAHHHGRGVTTFQLGTRDVSLEMYILGAWGRRPHDHYLMTPLHRLADDRIGHHHPHVQPRSNSRLRSGGRYK